MSLEWMLIRGSGLVAILLLAASVLWGLVLSLGVLPKSVKNLTLVHESLSVGALVATLVHMVGIALDEFVDFDLTAVLVPGRAPWKPLAVAWGVVAVYGMVVVILSFYMRKHIGQATWRSLHYLSFGVFLSALIHGITAGTDSSNPVVFAIYAGIGAAVLALIVLRIAMTGKDEPKPERVRPAATTSPTPSTSPTSAAPDGEPPASAPERKSRIPAEALVAAKAARAAKDTGEPDEELAPPPVQAAAPTVVEEAAPPRARIPQHLLERARVARQAAAPAAAAPRSAAAPAAAPEPSEPAVEAEPDTHLEPVLVGATAADEPAPRRPRIPPEALAKAAAMREAKDRG